jgi:hypothetical protein
VHRGKPLTREPSLTVAQARGIYVLKHIYMPTVQEWRQALTRQYNLRIESSDALCSEVDAAQRKRNNRGKSPVAWKPATPWVIAGNQTVPIKPIEMLQALGKISTPPITELIDLSSTWAEIRYVWAFRPDLTGAQPRALRLNHTVKGLDFHQKTLLSDEFGVGLAAHFMEVCAGASNPVDVFVAKRSGQVIPRGIATRSLPDYLFSGPAPGEFFIVECKGTQSSRPTAIRQLQRGTEQIRTVDVVGATKLTRLVIAAWLQRAITLLIVDPENDDDEAPEARTLSRWNPREAALFADAKRMTYIGDRFGASRVVREYLRENVLFDEHPLAERGIHHTTYRGSEWRADMPDGRRLRMFRGLEEGLHEYIKKVAPEERVAEVLTWHERFPVESEGENGRAVVRSFSRDGFLLEIEIT